MGTPDNPRAGPVVVSARATASEAPRGLTLLELLIGMTITSLMLGALASLVTGTLATWRQSMQTTAATEDALAALDQITRDIRVAGYDPLQRDLPAFFGTTRRRITLAADLNADGMIDRRSAELITYRRSRSGQLLRIVGRQAMPLLTGLTTDGLTFAYLDDRAQPINPRTRRARDEIRLVTIGLATRAATDRPTIMVAGGARLLGR